MRDFLVHSDTLTMKNVALLKIGRHFRYEGMKIIVGRNKSENETLIRNAEMKNLVFAAPDCGSPITLLRGDARDEIMTMAAVMTAAYSDAPGGMVTVSFGGRGREGWTRSMDVMKTEKDAFVQYLI